MCLIFSILVVFACCQIHIQSFNIYTMSSNIVDDIDHSCDDDEENIPSSSSLRTPPKKVRRQNYYNKDWEKSNYWLKEVKELPGKAKCTVCYVEFSIANKGHSAVNTHKISKQHQQKVNASKMSQQMSTFFAKSKTQDEAKIIACEVAQIFHNVKHNLSYNSFDCLMKLTSVVLPDSSIAKKLSCGRTKAETIVKNVFAPYFLKSILMKLKSDDLFFLYKRMLLIIKIEKCFRCLQCTFPKQMEFRIKS